MTNTKFEYRDKKENIKEQVLIEVSSDDSLKIDYYIRNLVSYLCYSGYRIDEVKVNLDDDIEKARSGNECPFTSVAVINIENKSDKYKLRDLYGRFNVWFKKNRNKMYKELRKERDKS